ncbi:unnamed protein product [Amoebophrya sp. A120]|nr:unnamed protein product [Amoebophrya sp. A120]|eukprot:GSA120T00000660001.1
MAGGSFGGIFKLAVFIISIWFAGKLSKLAGLSPIIMEIATGMLLGPQVFNLLPEEYTECAYQDQRNLCTMMDYQNIATYSNPNYFVIGENIANRVLNEKGQDKCGSPLTYSSATAPWKGDYDTYNDCMEFYCTKYYDGKCNSRPNIFTLLGHFGVSLMIFESGMHFHFPMLHIVGPIGSVIAFLGTFGPIGMGIVMTLLYGGLFDGLEIQGDAAPTMFMTGLTVGVAMAPTSVGIALALLTAAKRLDSKFGQTIICAAFLDDILSLIAFSLLFKINEDGVSVEAFFPLIFGVIFLLFGGYLAMHTIPDLCDKVFDKIRARYADQENSSVSSPSPDEANGFLIDQHQKEGSHSAPPFEAPEGELERVTEQVRETGVETIVDDDAAGPGATPGGASGGASSSSNPNPPPRGILSTSNKGTSSKVLGQLDNDKKYDADGNLVIEQDDGQDEGDVPELIPKHNSSASLSPDAPQSARDAVRAIKTVHLTFMVALLVFYSWLTDKFGSHLWGCFMAGMSFSNVPGSALIWSSQTKRLNAWMMRIFFSCTVGFAIPIKALLDGVNLGLGVLLGIFACILPKLLCAFWDKQDRFVIGWAMVGRAEFAYLIAEMGKAARLIGDDLFAQLIWALLCATITAPLGFSYMLRKKILQGEEGAVPEDEADQTIAHTRTTEVLVHSADLHAKAAHTKASAFLGDPNIGGMLSDSSLEGKNARINVDDVEIIGIGGSTPGEMSREVTPAMGVNISSKDPSRGTPVSISDRGVMSEAELTGGEESQAMRRQGGMVGKKRTDSKGQLTRSGTSSFVQAYMPHQHSSMSYVAAELRREPSTVLAPAFQAAQKK